MEDFFKQLRENMENRPGPPFEERDWQDLENRLGQLGKKRPAGFVWWWVALPFMLLLLVANAVSYLELKEANRKFSTLTARTDTIFQIRYIYLTDTIYQTRTVFGKTNGGTPSYFSYAATNPAQTLSESLGGPMGFRDLGSGIHPSVYRGLTAPWLSNPTAYAEGATGPLVVPGMVRYPGLVAIVFEEKPGLRLPLQPVLTEKKKTLRQHVYAMRPKGFSLGANSGWALPLKDGLKERGGFSAGLEAEVEFSPHLRLWADAAYSNVRFSSNRMDDAIGIPAVSPPGPEFGFVTAEVPQPSLQYSIGMQYVFNARRPFKPFIGVGWGGASLLPYEITYDFRDDANGIEWIFEKRVNNRGPLTGLLYFRAGLEHEFSQNWRWQFRAAYRSKSDKTGFQVPGILGFQAGLMYRF